MCPESEKPAFHFRLCDQEQGVSRCTAPGTYIAHRKLCMAERGHNDFQERERHVQRHQNSKHLGTEKPLLEIQNRGNIEEEGGWGMRLRFMENVEGHERKVGFLF